MGFSDTIQKPLLPETKHNQSEQQQQQQQRQQQSSSSYDRHYSLLPAMLMAFLTYNMATVAYRARNDVLTLAFIITSYVDFILLFVVGQELEKTPVSDVVKRGRLKVAAWVVALTLNMAVSYQTCLRLPFLLQVVVWCLSVVFVVGSFLMCFVYGDGGSEVKEQVYVMGEEKKTVASLSMV